VSKLRDLRQAIADSLVTAGIWQADAILIERQSDFWNDVATAMSAAKHGSILVIGVARGDATEEDELENDLTIPITILAQAACAPDQTPEEDLWEDTVRHLHGRILDYPGGGTHYSQRLRYQGFTDAPELVDGAFEVAQLARQTLFKIRLSL
jgi:hypothetical protein